MVQYLGKVLTRFSRDEAGAITVFIVGLFTTMILMGGAFASIAVSVQKLKLTQ